MKELRHITKHAVIHQRLRITKNIVYGARAMNAQLHPSYIRRTDDYDVYSKTPRIHAIHMKEKLNAMAGADVFYTKPAMHKGTHKVMDVGFDNRRGTKDDFGVVDYTKPTRKIKSIEIMGIRLAHISERKKDIRTSLRDPKFAYRHKKDRMDLTRIRATEKLRRLF